MYSDGPSPDGVRQVKGKSRGGSVLIAVIGVIIALIGVVFYLMFTPHSSPEVPALLDSVPLVLSENVREVPMQEQQAVAAASEPVVPEPAVEETAVSVVPETGYIYRFYTIAEGDKIDSISEKLMLQPSTILSVNSIKNLNSLREGNVIRYPEIDGQLYIVRSGDTAERIVLQKNPDMTSSELLELNRLETLNPGDEIFIPSPPKFASPVPDGTVLYQNGDYYQGESLEGVIIQAEAGAPVLAAADGTVIDWSNNGEQGYSVTLMHEDSYQTLYCFLGSLDQPSPGKKVKKGGKLGTVGENGLDGAYILFKLTQMGVPIDPELIMKF